MLTVREVVADVIKEEGGIGVLKRLYDKVISRFKVEGLNPPNKESIRETLGSHTIKDPEGKIGRKANTSGVKFERLSNGIYKIADGNNDACVVIEGDARDLEGAGLEEGSVNLIIADHPWSEGHNHRSGNQKNFAQDYENTTFMYEKFDFEQKYRALSDGGYCVENIPAENHVNTKYLRKIREHAESAGLEFYSLVPYRKFDVPKNTGRTQKDREYLLIFTKGKARRLAPKGKPYMTREMLPAEFNVTKEMKELKKSHQAEKPVALWESVIQLMTEPGEIICDQFSGSGSASLAARRTGRFPIAIELLSENIKKIRNRLGLPAVLEDKRKEVKEHLNKVTHDNAWEQMALF